MMCKARCGLALTDDRLRPATPFRFRPVRIPVHVLIRAGAVISSRGLCSLCPLPSPHPASHAIGEPCRRGECLKLSCSLPWTIHCVILGSSSLHMSAQVLFRGEIKQSKNQPRSPHGPKPTLFRFSGSKVISLAPRQPCFPRRKTEWRDWCPRPCEPPRRAAVQGGESHRSCEQPMHAYLHSSGDAHRRPSGSRELRSHLTNVPKQKHLPPLMTLHAAPTEMIMPNNRNISTVKGRDRIH